MGATITATMTKNSIMLLSISYSGGKDAVAPRYCFGVFLSGAWDAFTPEMESLMLVSDCMFWSL